MTTTAKYLSTQVVALAWPALWAPTVGVSNRDRSNERRSRARVLKLVTLKCTRSRNFREELEAVLALGSPTSLAALVTARVDGVWGATHRAGAR